MQPKSTTAGAARCPHQPRSHLSCPVAPPVALAAAAPSLPSPPPVPPVPAEAVIADWLTSRDAADFPYDAVVAAYHRVGKHQVASALLDRLAQVRDVLPTVRGAAAATDVLARFLDTALDKRDGRYANPTYLGLSLLQLPTLDDRTPDLAAVARRYDRLLVSLVADAIRFELAVADGTTDFLPELRPDHRTVAKRCRLGLQIVAPAAHRLGLAAGVDPADPAAAARRLWTNVAAALTPDERRVLQLTMLPVSLVHDEYQFIRALQSFEATFALMAVALHAAIQAISGGAATVARARILTAATLLHEAASLFSLVGTMQVAAFHAFRVFTDGASAIQSRNYKLVESLCRRPEAARLDAAAYRSVPEVRERVRAGQTTLDEAFLAARAGGRLDARDLDELEAAMAHFAATLQRWRRTHHRIAVRMLGERTGTGYTEGAAYLKAVQAIPVFTALPAAAGDLALDPEDQDGETPSPAPHPVVESARGRCPFAAGLIPLAQAMDLRREATGPGRA